MFKIKKKTYLAGNLFMIASAKIKTFNENFFLEPKD